MCRSPPLRAAPSPCLMKLDSIPSGRNNEVCIHTDGQRSPEVAICRLRAWLIIALQSLMATSTEPIVRACLDKYPNQLPVKTQLSLLGVLSLNAIQKISTSLRKSCHYKASTGAKRDSFSLATDLPFYLSFRFVSGRPGSVIPHSLHNPLKRGSQTLAFRRNYNVVS